MPPTEPEHRDMREVDGFTILKAAEAGRLPEELQDSLEDLAEAVASVQQDPKGVVGMRYGRRIVVAPVDDPDQAVDVADVDLARHVILTLGGKDPGPAGSLLAQVLFQRTDAVVGYAEARKIQGPTMDVLRQVLVPLQASGATHIEGVGTVAVGKLVTELTGALGELKANQAGDDGDEPKVNH